LRLHFPHATALADQGDDSPSAAAISGPYLTPSNSPLLRSGECSQMRSLRLERGGI